MPIIGAAIWGFLKNLPWGKILAVLAILSVIYGAYSWAYDRGKDAEATHVKPSLDRAFDRIQRAQQNIQALDTALKHQNAAVDFWKKDGDRRVAEGKANLVKSQRENQSLADQAAALRKSATRKLEGAPCPVSDTLSKVKEL